MIAQRQSHRALELLYFSTLSSGRRRTPAWMTSPGRVGCSYDPAGKSHLCHETKVLSTDRKVEAIVSERNK
jgi:hypothetical protein